MQSKVAWFPLCGLRWRASEKQSNLVVVLLQQIDVTFYCWRRQSSTFSLKFFTFQVVFFKWLSEDLLKNTPSTKLLCEIDSHNRFPPQCSSAENLLSYGCSTSRSILSGAWKTYLESSPNGPLRLISDASLCNCSAKFQVSAETRITCCILVAYASLEHFEGR